MKTTAQTLLILLLLHLPNYIQLNEEEDIYDGTESILSWCIADYSMAAEEAKEATLTWCTEVLIANTIDETLH